MLAVSVSQPIDWLPDQNYSSALRKSAGRQLALRSWRIVDPATGLDFAVLSSR